MASFGSKWSDPASGRPALSGFCGCCWHSTACPFFLYRAAPLLKVFAEGPLNIIVGRPLAFFGGLLGVSIIAYLPAAIIFGPLRWIGIGPFHAQAGRISLYLVYFLTGTAVGTIGIDRSDFKAGGTLAKRWWAWVAVGVMSFGVFIMMLVIVTPHGANHF